MKQLSLDIAEIKNIIGDKYTSRNKASLVCLADEKTHHIVVPESWHNCRIKRNAIIAIFHMF